MKSFLLTFFMLFYAAGSRASAPSDSGAPLLAVIDIINNTGQYKPFVAGMPDMLITELLENGNLKLVERTKIQTAMEALKIEASGLTEEGNLQLGKWLGADRIIVGAFNKFERKFRLDIRVIDVKTGTIAFAASSTKGYEHLLEIIPEVGQQLRKKLSPPKPIEKPQPVSGVIRKKPAKHDFCRLHIEYKMIVGLFMQNPVPHQKVKVYLDGELVHISGIINRLNSYFTIFSGIIPPGDYQLTLVHGTINTDGSWRDNLAEQPRNSIITCRGGERVTLRYRMRAQDRFNTFSTPKEKI